MTKVRVCSSVWGFLGMGIKAWTLAWCPSRNEYLSYSESQVRGHAPSSSSGNMGGTKICPGTPTPPRPRPLLGPRDGERTRGTGTLGPTRTIPTTHYKVGTSTGGTRVVGRPVLLGPRGSLPEVTRGEGSAGVDGTSCVTMDHTTRRKVLGDLNESQGVGMCGKKHKDPGLIRGVGPDVSFTT